MPLQAFGVAIPKYDGQTPTGERHVGYATSPENWLYGIDIADLNQDGRPDIYTANTDGRSASVLLGRDDGSFATAVTERFLGLVRLCVCWMLLCHMATASHRFSGEHDASWLRQTLSAQVFMSSGNLLHVVVRALGLGHRFPTGDPFRCLQADICEARTAQSRSSPFRSACFFAKKTGAR